MTKHDRHDELVALLTEIRDRLPEAEGVNAAVEDGLPHITEDQPVGTRIADLHGDVWKRFEDGWGVCVDGAWGKPARTFHYVHGRYAPLRLATPADLARVGIEDEPAPADDLPGEPVEPSGLRAGDRVSFTWAGTAERIVCTLVSNQPRSALISDTPSSSGYSPGVVKQGDRWCYGVSDVRLLKRAPREDESRRLTASVAVWKSEVVKSARRQAAAMAERDEQKARAEQSEEVLRKVREVLDNG